MCAENVFAMQPHGEKITQKITRKIEHQVVLSNVCIHIVIVHWWYNFTLHFSIYKITLSFFFLSAQESFPQQLTYPEMAWPMWNPNLTHSCGSPRIGHRMAASGDGRPSGRSTRTIYYCTPRGRPESIRTGPTMSRVAGPAGCCCCCGAAGHPAREIDVA